MNEVLPPSMPDLLASKLRERTGFLHTKAERSGIVHDILRGHADRDGYASYLCNLLPAYQEMERGLERHRRTPGFRGIAEPVLFRSRAIRRDLAAIRGAGWARSLKLLPAGQNYASRVALAAGGDGTALIGHAYTRYLGDLSGAQLLKRSLVQSLRLGPEMLSFYGFPGIPDLRAFKDGYRAALNDAGREIGDVEIVLAEAVLAFQHNIEVSEAVQAAAAA